MAEAVFNSMVRERNMGMVIHCDSAGTGDYHIGSRPHPGTLNVLEAAGIETLHRARQLTLHDFSQYTHILVMDRDNLRDTLALASGPAEIQLITNFSDLYPGCDVPDPYFDGRFDVVFEMVTNACTGFLDRYEARLKLEGSSPTQQVNHGRS